jgi:hypothetical protein
MGQEKISSLNASNTKNRQPNFIMKLARMGSFFPFRLSFARIMLRNLMRNKVKIERSTWNFDADGFGHAVYSLNLSGKNISLLAFSNFLKKSLRTDRVIASAWDTSFALFDGIPTHEDISRLKKQLPLQEAGRYNKTELVLSRANKSIRMFNTITDNLSRGQQPSKKLINEIGYLMRTTAVYGNGKFGINDRNNVKSHSNFLVPFQMEMLTVYLIRNFSIDLVHHVARNKCPHTFIELDREIQRHLGIGNATGLGMAPFLVKHPVLLNNWFQVRETALSKTLDLVNLNEKQRLKVIELLSRSSDHLGSWFTSDTRQSARIKVLISEWNEIKVAIGQEFLKKDFALKSLFDLVGGKSFECQELMVSLLIEIGGKDLEGLEHCLESTLSPQLQPNMSVKKLRNLLSENFSWVFDIDFSSRNSTARFWYVSEEKLEPRLGNRYEEEGADLERPLDIAKKVSLLSKDLKDYSDKTSIAEFLMKFPNHRYALRRIQTNAWAPYSEIHENLIDEKCMPVDMLRCKLSFFGASKFDPKSDRWVRVNLFQGAPLSDEICTVSDDDWWMPVLKES